ncbi:MAG: hypothetical protein ACE5F6_15460 [Anaerolineae bacterium]
MRRFDQSVAFIAALLAGLLCSACAAPATPPPTTIPIQTPQPASPTTAPTQTPQPPSPTTAPTETPEPPTPTAMTVQAARLPAPLYFLAAGQVHRLEMDGVTLTQITDAPRAMRLEGAGDLQVFQLEVEGCVGGGRLSEPE